MIIPRIYRNIPKIVPFRYYCKQEKPAEAGGTVSAAVLKKLECKFKEFENTESCSLLKKHLTEEIFEKIKKRITPTYKSSLLDCIQAGLENPDCNVGVFAACPESYTTFSELFDKIIADIHGFTEFKPHPPICYGNGCDFPDLDPEQKFVVSTSIRCGRSLKDFPFNPKMSRCNYVQVQDILVGALRNLCCEHKGKYFPLFEMDDCCQEKLVRENILFTSNDANLQDANALNSWPMGRGVYLNPQRTFVVWINEEDHVRVISMEPSGNLGRVYERLVIGIESLEHQLNFAKNDRLGHLTMSPANLGNTILASVHMRMPWILMKKEKLDELIKKYNLQIRAMSGGVYDVSNKRRFGMTEYETILNLYNAIDEMIQLECQGAAEVEEMRKKNYPNPCDKEDKDKKDDKNAKGNQNDKGKQNAKGNQDEDKCKQGSNKKEPPKPKKYDSSKCNKKK